MHRNQYKNEYLLPLAKRLIWSDSYWQRNAVKSNRFAQNILIQMKKKKRKKITRKTSPAHIRIALATYAFLTMHRLTHLSIVCDICCCCSGIGCWIFIALEPPSFCLCDVVVDNVVCLCWLSEKNNVNIVRNRPAQISFGLIVSTSQCRSRNAFRQLFTFSYCSKQSKEKHLILNKVKYFRICNSFRLDALTHCRSCVKVKIAFFFFLAPIRHTLNYKLLNHLASWPSSKR